MRQERRVWRSSVGHQESDTKRSRHGATLRGESSTLPEGLRAAFGIGATLASFVWFFALGFGARGLRGLFERPMAWKILDATIALVMWAIAASLLLGS